MAGFVRIHVRGTVQTLRCLIELARAAIKIEQLQQRLAVIAFPVGGVIQLAQKLQKLRRRAPRRRQVFHDGDELAPLPATPLELFQLARQGHGGVGLLRVQQVGSPGTELEFAL